MSHARRSALTADPSFTEVPTALADLPRIAPTDVTVGMVIATIPSVASGRASSTQGLVVNVDPFEIRGRTFVTITLRGESGISTITNLGADYALVAAAPTSKES